MNFYNNFQVLLKVNYHSLMKAVIHIPAMSCRWIIIILQLGKISVHVTPNLLGAPINRKKILYAVTIIVKHIYNIY